jgi:hypothetical protein
MNTDTTLINSQIDIREVAEHAGAEFTNNRARCPIHGGDNQTAFEIFDNGRAFTCHTRAECNQFGHDGIGLLRALNNWTFRQVAERYTKPQDPQETARRAAEYAKRIEQDLQRKIEEAQKAVEELRKARKWLEDHDSMTDAARGLWRKRGIPDDWQNYWSLGYRENFTYFYDNAPHSSPTLSIPLFQPFDDEPSQVKHRLLNPVNPRDKYRPERKGLEALPFLGDRDLPIDASDRVIIVEGEIKAAVTFLTLDHALWQVIGLPGKDAWRKIIPSLAGTDAVIILDPDAKKDACDFARAIGGAKVVDLPEKIDDLIIKHRLSGQWLETIFHNARMVK